MSFTNLGLRAEILLAIGEQGYDTPTPIQAKAIPLVLEGRDLMASAQTGTGKTAGFTLPILQLLSSRNQGTDAKRFKSRALILTPTRELAVQVHESVRTYGKHLGLRSAAIYGGVGMGPQTKALRAGTDILVATPGRLLDHIQQRSADLSGIEILVLDEADRMLDMGFIADIKKILALLPKQKQCLLFSATFSDEIRSLASGLMRDPASVDVAVRNAATTLVKQSVYLVDRARKRDLLVQLIEDHGWHQVLVFARTKHGADALAERLDKAGIRSAALHGNKTQGARQRALEDFKRNKVVVLVATDIAARGIDIDQLPHVINFELPNVAEDYVHRIGRTGRAGANGEAISLVCVDEHRLLRDIEQLLKKTIEKKVLPGFEPDPSIRAEPIQNGRRSAGAGAGKPQRQGEPRRAAGKAQRPPQRGTSSRGAGAPSARKPSGPQPGSRQR
jgi:ATP-dependent RNA helicase RhlE